MEILKSEAFEQRLYAVSYFVLYVCAFLLLLGLYLLRSLTENLIIPVEDFASGYMDNLGPKVDPELLDLN